MAARQVVRFTKEVATTPGVFDDTATVITLIRLTNPIVEQPKPIRWTLRDAGSSGRRSQTGSAQFENRIQVETELRLSQAAIFLPAFLTPTTTGAGLTTFSVDRYDVMEDSGHTKSFLRQLGMTPETLKVTANNSGQGVLFKMSMGFVGRTWDRTVDITDIPVPADADYPTDLPFEFEETSAVTLGSSRANFSMFDLTCKNTLDYLYDENPNPSPKFYGARDIDWSLNFLWKAITDRTDFEAVNAKAVSFVITRGGTSITFNLNGANYLSSVDDEKPLDKAFRQKISGEAFYDSAVGTDLTLTVDSTP